LKIGLLTTSFPRYRGDGAGVFIYDLARHLVQKGCDVTVLAPHDGAGPLRESWDRLRIVRFRYFYPEPYQKLCYGAGVVNNIKTSPVALLQVPPLILMQFFACRKLIQQENIDLLHAHWTVPQGLTGFFCRSLYEIPYIVTIHGTDIHGLNYPLLSDLNRLVLRHAAACTANSVVTARAAQRLSASTAPQIIPMGVDPALFRAARPDPSLPDPEAQGPVILFVGRLMALKGIRYLLGAMPRILSTFPQTNLYIVGDGPERARLEGMCVALGIQDNVRFFGEVPHQDLPPYYTAADVFVLPSCRDKTGALEGLGVVLLEAMACGVPVVGSDIGGIPQIIENGVTGLLSEPESSDSLARNILQILENQRLATRLRAAGLKQVQNEFSWDSISAKFLKIYERTLSHA